MTLRNCGSGDVHQPHRWPQLGGPGGRRDRYYCPGGETLDPVPGDAKAGSTELVPDGVWRDKPIDFDRVYYISGPITGYPEHNHPAFEDAVNILTRLGLKVVSPHTLPVPEIEDRFALWKHMMKACMDLLDTAQAIVMLPGWPQSRGARAELSVALDRNMDVFFLDNFLLINMNREQINVGP